MSSTTAPKRILHVVTNVSHYEDPENPTGLWVGELSHAYDLFAEKGYEQVLVSPKGGKVPTEPKSLKMPMVDKSAKAFMEKHADLLENTKRPEDIDPTQFDAIYYTGGHAVMFDFLDDEKLQTLTRQIWEQGNIVSSVCHGYVGLLNVKLSDGDYLVKDKKVTGFSWNEEVLAGVSKHVPYNSEEEMKKRGAHYEKNLLPFTSRATVDGKLITGQNPQSAKATAEAIVKVLEGKQ